VTETASTPASSTPSKAAPEAPVRTPEEIQADIDAAHERLAASVDELSERLSPASLAEDAKGSIKGVFVDEYGSVKPKPVAIVVGSVVGLVVLRAIFHRD
jgi:Protein of unknown function (DUF3618)